MQPFGAFDMGYDAASSGFFFDSMELAAALSVRLGGFDRMRSALALLFAQRDVTESAMRRVSEVVTQAFKKPISPPIGVDEYRNLLENGVFEIVNRWSYIRDINQINRLQAWFYVGFGLGRGTTVLRGIELIPRLFELVGKGTELDSTPKRLQLLAAEAAKQLEISSDEDDLQRIRPLLQDAAQRLKRVSLSLHLPVAEIRWDSELVDDLEILHNLGHKIRLDMAT